MDFCYTLKDFLNYVYDRKSLLIVSYADLIIYENVFNFYRIDIDTLKDYYNYNVIYHIFFCDNQSAYYVKCYKRGNQNVRCR